MKKIHDQDPCPCGGGLFNKCCKPILVGDQVANTPEKLMRSRYTAYVLGEESYLLKTWAKETRPQSCLYESEVKWLGLTVKSASIEPDGTRGTVEFVARFKMPSQPAVRLHESSQFENRQGQWLYVGGQIFSS